MYSKRKGVVTRKEENHYYIRYYGESIANTSGFNAKLGVDLAINENKDLSVGDFVETQYHEGDGLFENGGWSFGFTCEKIEPTEEDIKENQMLQRYLDEVAEQGGKFFKDILLDSQSEFRNESTPNPMHILLSDEEVLSLIQKYKESIQTFGIAGASGTASFIIQTQLGRNNSFDKNPQRYRDIIGDDDAPFMRMQLPSCLSRVYVDGRFYDGIADIGNPRSYWGSMYSISGFKENLFKVVINESEVTSIPYEIGSAIKVREKHKEEYENYFNSKAESLLFGAEKDFSKEDENIEIDEKILTETEEEISEKKEIENIEKEEIESQPLQSKEQELSEKEASKVLKEFNEYTNVQMAIPVKKKWREIIVQKVKDVVENLFR